MLTPEKLYKLVSTWREIADDQDRATEYGLGVGLAMETVADDLEYLLNREV
jgi:hypothetical protein